MRPPAQQVLQPLAGRLLARLGGLPRYLIERVRQQHYPAPGDQVLHRPGRWPRQHPLIDQVPATTSASVLPCALASASARTRTGTVTSPGPTCGSSSRASAAQASRCASSRSNHDLPIPGSPSTTSRWWAPASPAQGSEGTPGPSSPCGGSTVRLLPSTRPRAVPALRAADPAQQSRVQGHPFDVSARGQMPWQAPVERPVIHFP
jgi:hypothetical protein